MEDSDKPTIITGISEDGGVCHYIMAYGNFVKVDAQGNPLHGYTVGDQGQKDVVNLEYWKAKLENEQRLLEKQYREQHNIRPNTCLSGDQCADVQYIKHQAKRRQAEQYPQDEECSTKRKRGQEDDSESP